ncbi:hemopexin repeat-containing protein [Sulfitobacter sp. S190]|uniref:hemopexin repeat-containing protein n=1 Tax=Sulfitobacter sp. S190 TaxID=2867022 RepID=UPI0021A4001A|nr:hemopexin repeat-containing protein [Sulfitobacter sp. S190]UWR22820.1 hypothetical protein K3756_02120 [Sulfitobacter sp. S190]
MLDAAHTHTNNKMYFFSGAQYWRFDLARGRTDPGYPQPIARFWKGVPRNPDAVVEGQGDRAHKIYFFSGDRYTRYDTQTNHTDPGYPRSIASGWSGVWSSGVDAAVTLPTNNKLYFFKGSHYVRYDWDKNQIDAGYPKSIASAWSGLTGPFDAVLGGTGDRAGKVYFFSGDEYWRYDTTTERVDAGYPKPQSVWTGVGGAAPARPVPTDHTNRLAAFRAGTGPGAWPELDRATVADQIAANIATPLIVDQARTPLCGPAAIVYLYAKRRPDDYARFCIDLFEKGHARMRTKTLHPSALVKSSSPAGLVNQADWMVMAAMRDAENALFDIDGTEQGWEQGIVQGVTTPWEMKGWLREMLMLGDVTYESCAVWGEEAAVKSCDTACKAGGVGLMMVSAALAGNPAPRVAFPDHWVVFEGALNIDHGDWWRHDSGHFKFRVWSWGGILPVSLSEGRFEDYMWGVVYGT